MPDHLRLALLTAKLSPAAGGLAVSVPGLAHSLNKAGDMEVHVLGTEDRLYPGAEQEWGHNVHVFPTRGPVALQLAPAMAGALAQLAPTIVDVQGIWTWASKISFNHYRRYNRPYIVTPRGMLDPWSLQHSAWKKFFFRKFIEDAHLKHAFCLRATSELEASHFRRIGLTNYIAVVPNGITIPPLAPRQSRTLRTILYLGRLHPKKGLAILLTAWEALHNDFPDWQLVIAGIDENNHRGLLQRLAETKRLPRLQFAGEVYGLQKQLLYRNSDLFVLPTHGENFGLVVAEALAQEIPVITTTNAPWSGLHTHDCGWWIQLDQVRLIETMRDAMSRPAATLDQMGRRGRFWIEKEFGMRQMANRMRNVYLWAAGRASKPDDVHS